MMKAFTDGEEKTSEVKDSIQHNNNYIIAPDHKWITHTNNGNIRTNFCMDDNITTIQTITGVGPSISDMRGNTIYQISKDISTINNKITVTKVADHYQLSNGKTYYLTGRGGYLYCLETRKNWISQDGIFTEDDIRDIIFRDNIS